MAARGLIVGVTLVVVGGTIAGAVEAPLTLASPPMLVVAVSDPFGDPVPGAKVEVYTVQNRTLVATEQTGPCGLARFTRFTIDPRKRYDIAVSLMGFVTRRLRSVAIGSNGPTIVGTALALPDNCPPGSQICM